jgi:hypothetical protein
MWEGRKRDGFGDSFKNIEWTILNGSNMKNILKDYLILFILTIDCNF